MAKEFSKKKGLKALLGSAVCAGALVFSSGAQALNVFIDWDGDTAADTSATGAPGDTFTGSVYADITAADLNGETLVSYATGLTFSNLTDFTTPSFTTNSALWNGNFGFNNSSDPLRYDVSGSVSDPFTEGVSTAGTYLLYSFTTSSAVSATTSVTLGIEGGDATNDFVLFSSLTPLSATFDSPSTVTAVTPVPLPPAIWLLGAGIAGLLGYRKKLSQS